MFSAIFVIVIAIMIAKQVSLSDRVKFLEMEQRRLNGQVPAQIPVPGVPQPQSNDQSVFNPPVSPVYSQASVSATYSKVVPAQYEEGAISKWLKENWLLKLGVLMILIAFGWFISYAFVHDWIGPVGRVTLGFVAGSLCAIFGTMRMAKNSIQGITFLILGSALVVITSFASQLVYGFFSPAIAVFIPFIVALYVATVAATYNYQSVGIYAVVIGFLAPVLTHGERLDPNLLFIYLAVMSLACIWLSVRKNWRSINVLSLAGIFLYSIGDVFIRDGNYFMMTILFGLSIVYFAVSILSVIKSKIDASPADVVVAVLNSILVMLVTMTKVPDELQSLVLAAWMIVFGFGSMFAFTKTQKQTFFFIYSMIAVVYLAVATALELDGPALIFAYAIESAAVSIASYIVTKNYDIGLRMSLLMVGPAFMALPSFGSYRFAESVFNQDFFIIALIGFLLMLMGGFYAMLRRQMKEGEHSYVVHITAGSAFLLALLWTALHAGLDNQSQATMIALVIYTILGIICYFSGHFNDNKTVKHYGGTLIILVVIRLLLVDVWNMPLAPRIVTFVLIGTLFISTAFITKKKKEAQIYPNEIN